MKRLEGLAGHRAMVVGVSASLGVAVARRLAQLGAHVTILDNDASALARAARDLERDAIDVDVVPMPTSSAEAARRAGALVEGWEAGLDVLVYCGGVVDWWPEAEDHWDEAVESNLIAPIRYSEALEPALVRSGRASVVYYGTIDGLLGNPRVPTYSVSRGGLVPWTHIFAHRLGRHGGRANYVAGATLTLNGADVPRGQRQPGWNAEDARRQTALGRFAEPEEAADVVAFLAGPGSSYVSGSVLTMDGGRTSITPGTALDSGPGPAAPHVEPK